MTVLGYNVARHGAFNHYSTYCMTNIGMTSFSPTVFCVDGAKAWVASVAATCVYPLKSLQKYVIHNRERTQRRGVQ
jgi:hypothetical protein